MNNDDPISFARLLGGGVLIVASSFLLARFLIGARAFTVFYPWAILLVVLFACWGFRFLARTRLSKSFGIGMKVVAFGLILLPVGSYFQYFNPMSGIAMIQSGVLGVFLLLLGDDIMERPALPQASREIFGDARNASDRELDRALRDKSGDAEPMFRN
jgi:hypothetical protein